MSRITILCLVLTLALAFLVSCSGGSDNAITPPAEERIQVADKPGTTNLLGFWQVVIDTQNETIEAIDMRSSDLIINVLGFMEPPPLSSMSINFTTLVISDPTIAVDVIFSHPIPDAVFKGFDVRGIVFGAGLNNADGYTDVCNPEFFVGVPFGYQDGLLGVPDSVANYSGIAGYKYFADGIGLNDDITTFFSVEGNLDDRGVFSEAPATHSRHYELDWTDSTQPFFTFNYAVYANYNWPVGDPGDGVSAWDISTANSAEAFACKVTELANSLYYSSGSGGGSIQLELEVWDWQGDIVDVTAESWDPGIITQAAYTSTSAGTTTKSTIFGFDPLPGSPTEVGDLDILITVTDSLTFGDAWFMALLPPSNSKFADPIYNCFVHTATVVENSPPQITSGVDGAEEPFEETVEQYSVTANDPEADPLTYSWTLTDVATSDPVDGYDGVAGNGDGTIDIDWGDWPYAWALAGAEFELDCTVADPSHSPIPADTLEIEVTVDGDIWVSNHADFASVPDNGTKAEPFSTPNQALSAISSNPGATIVIDYGTGTYDMTSYMYHYSTTYNNVTWRGYSWYTDPGGRPTLRKMHSSSYGWYIYGVSNLTVQGLKLEFNSSYSGNNMFYLSGSSQNPTIRDCVFTGTNYSSTVQCVDEWSCPGFTFTHNLVDGIGSSVNYSSGTMYAVRMTNSISGTRTVTYNEFTDLFPSSAGNYRYTQLRVIDLRTPGGTINMTNNLIHHVKPSYNSGYAEQTGYAFYNSTGNYGTYNFSNNTVDQLDFSNSAAIGYGLTAYYNRYTGQAPVSRSNIVSTYHGNPSQYMTGYYHYYNGVNGVTYCDAFNIDDLNWSGFTNMTGNITVDPEYVNNTTAPYDYHLDSGSPCEGTGYNGEDMGCYGNMATGETIVGIVTPA